MSEESRVCLSSVLTISEAASALGTTVEIMRFLCSTRRIAYLKLGNSVRFMATDIEDAIARRGELLSHANGIDLKDRRVLVFEQDSLDAEEVAAFFGIPAGEAREVLGIGNGQRIDKAKLWTLIATSVDRDSFEVVRMEQRLSKSRELRSRTVSSLVREAVRQRDQDTCRYCGLVIIGAPVNMDHVIPKSRNGDDSASNLVVACGPCNSIKKDRLPHEAGFKILAIGSTRLPSYRTRAINAPSRPYAELVEGISPKRRKSSPTLSPNPA